MLRLGFPAGTSGKEPACQCRRPKRHWFDPWVQKIPWRRAWQPTSKGNLVSILAWEISRTEKSGMWAIVHRVAKSGARLSAHTHAQVIHYQTSSPVVLTVKSKVCYSTDTSAPGFNISWHKSHAISHKSELYHLLRWVTYCQTQWE